MVKKNDTEATKKDFVQKETMQEELYLKKMQELEAKISAYDEKLKKLDAKTPIMHKTDKQKRNMSHEQKMKRDQEKDREMVKGMFKFYEVPGGALSFVYHKYKGDPVEKFTMQDGQVYSVPLGVAKHLNSSGSYPRHQYYKTETGTNMRIGEKIRRYGFQSLDFVDLMEKDPVKEVVTVEHAF